MAAGPGSHVRDKMAADTLVISGTACMFWLLSASLLRSACSWRNHVLAGLRSLQQAMFFAIYFWNPFRFKFVNTVFSLKCVIVYVIFFDSTPSYYNLNTCVGYTSFFMNKSNFEIIIKYFDKNYIVISSNNVNNRILVEIYHFCYFKIWFNHKNKCSEHNSLS